MSPCPSTASGSTLCVKPSELAQTEGIPGGLVGGFLSFSSVALAWEGFAGAGCDDYVWRRRHSSRGRQTRWRLCCVFLLRLVLGSGSLTFAFILVL